MLKSLEVANFRSLQSLSVHKLRRVNIVTGRNGAGKTSLLEAVFLNAGTANAALVFTVNAFRGENSIGPDSDRYFRALFHDQDASKPIRISCDESRAARGSKGRSLVIDPIWQTRVAPGRSAGARVVSGVRLTFKGPAGERTSFAEWNDPLATSQLPSGVPVAPPIRLEGPSDHKDLIYGQFISPYIRDLYAETRDQLREQIRNKSMENLLRVVNIVEPAVKNIVPLSEGNDTIIYVDVGQSQLLPLSSLGSGFFHVLRLALAMAAIEKGLVLVDEIEDGLHYSVMGRVADAIMEKAGTSDAQFFISTHSNEMLNIFVQAAKDAKFEDICLINIAGKGERTTVRYFDPEELDFAMSAESELR